MHFSHWAVSLDPIKQTVLTTIYKNTEQQKLKLKAQGEE